LKLQEPIAKFQTIPGHGYETRIGKDPGDVTFAENETGFVAVTEEEGKSALAP